MTAVPKSFSGRGLAGEWNSVQGSLSCYNMQDPVNFIRESSSRITLCNIVFRNFG